MYKEDLAINSLQCLLCDKIKPNQTKPKPQRHPLKGIISPDLLRKTFKVPTSSQTLMTFGRVLQKIKSKRDFIES